MAKKRTIRDSIKSAYIGVNDNDSDKIYDSLPSEYKPRNYNEISDGVFNIFRNDNNEKTFLKNLKKKFSIDMSKYSGEYRSELFKDIFKFGIYQRLTNTGGLIDNIPDSSTMLRLINDHRSEIIFSNSIVTDLNSLNDAQKTAIQKKLLKPLMNLIPEKAWTQAKQYVQDAAFNSTPFLKLAEGVVPALTAIANSPFASLNKTGLNALKAQQENFKLNHVGTGNAEAGVRYTQYRNSSAPTVYREAAIQEKKAAIKGLAPIFQQVRLDLANEVMSPVQQTGEQLLEKTVDNIISPVFFSRKTSDQVLVRDMYQMRQAKDNMAKNGVVGYDYETIGDQIHEFSYLTADINTKAKGKEGEVTAEPKITKKVTGLIGLHSEVEKSRVEEIINNLEKHETIEEDSKYILQRLWAIGKAANSGFIKQNSKTRRFTLQDFYDVNDANMQEIDVIKKGYETLVDIGEKQKKQHKVEVDYNGKQYKIVPFERDLLMPLIEAVDNNQTIMAYNGLNFDTTKMFKMFAQGDYISDDARALFYASGISELKGYQNYFDPMIAVRAGAVGRDQLYNKRTRQAIMAEGQTYNTNTATYIRSGAKNGNKGVIHTGEADTFKMLVTAIHSGFGIPKKDEKTFYDNLGMDSAQSNLEKVGLGSVLSFDSPLAPFNANINGLMFTVDPLTRQYRIAGNGTTISYSVDGTPNFDEKAFGSYFTKDAPYVVTGIQQYTQKDIEAFGKNAVALDSSVLSDTIYGIKLTRLTANGEGLAKTQPIHLITSKTGFETLLSTTATYHGDISAFFFGDNPNGIKISDITADSTGYQDLAKYLFEITPALQAESEKKARENIALKPLETWHNLNRHGKEKESLADILGKSPDMQSAEAEIISKLQQNSSYFGFKINSINHLENIIGAYSTLKAYDDAGIFADFESAFGDKFSKGVYTDSKGKARNIYDKGRMFAQYVSNLKESVNNLVQAAGPEDVKIPIPKEYKNSHFQFDLSNIAGKSKVHAALDDGFSDALVTFDIRSENTLNSFNRKAVSKLTRLLGFKDDQAGRNRALRTFGKKLSNYYGQDYNVSEMANFEEALLDDIILRMRNIRESTTHENLPTQRKPDVKDTAFTEVYAALDNDTRQKIISEAVSVTGDVKQLPRDKKNNIIKADILANGNKYTVHNFGDTDITNHDKLLNFIANEIGEEHNSNRVQNTAKEIEENLSSINEMTDFLLDQIVSGGGYDLIERPNEGYFLSTGIGGEELNITALLPSIKWNSELCRGQVYIGRTPIANMETAYIDNNGAIQFGREFDAIMNKMALMPRMKYKGTMNQREQLNYIASLFQEFNQNARQFSVIRKDNEDLQKIKAFDYRDLYDRILSVFSDNQEMPNSNHEKNPKRYRQYVAEQFIDAINNMSAGELSSPEGLKKWAQSLADIESWSPSITTSIANHQLFLREHMYDIFKAITSNGDVYSLFFNDGTTSGDTIERILNNLKNINIGTRHANQAIAYLDEDFLAFEGIGGPHKRHENYAEKRNKILDIGKHARYIDSMRFIIGDDNAQTLEKASGYQSIFKGASDALGENKKTYTGLVLETTHGNYKEILESDAFRQHIENKGYSSKIVDKIMDDLNIYLGESSSIVSPYHAALNRPQSMQRIHASDVIPRSELRMMSDASEWQKAGEFKRRKELDFTLRLRDGNEKVLFTYGDPVRVDQGQHIITTKRYPDSSQREKAINHGRVSMRYYKTIQGAQVVMSEEEINRILNTEENLIKIASAMETNGKASQDNLTTMVDNILSEHGATRDYVLHEDFDSTARKILYNSQEKSMGTSAIVSLGRYDQRITKFFNNLGIGGIYLDRKVSIDFIDSIASKTASTNGRESVIKFNEESSLFQAVLRDKAFRKSFIEYRQKLKEEREDLKQQLKNAQAELQEATEKRKQQGDSLQENLAKIQEHIANIKEKLNKVESTSQLRYKDAVQIKLAHELKKVFGSDATAETLQKAIRKEQSLGWDILTEFLGKIYGIDDANVKIAGIANTTSEITKESHGEARGILTNIASGLVTHYMHNDGMSREDAIIATRKYFNDNFLEDNSPRIDIATGTVPEGLRISTTKMQQHEKEISRFLEGVVPDKNNTLLQEIFPDGSEGRMRLVSAEIQTMSDPEGSRGHSIDKNKGFVYSTRVNTSLDYRRYDEEDIQNVFNFYKDKSSKPKELAKNIDKFNRLYKGIAEGIIENGEARMNLLIDNPASIKMFENVIDSLNRAVEQNVKLDENGLPIITPAPEKITDIAVKTAEKYNISVDRAYQIYAQQSVARAYSFNNKMQSFYSIEENQKLTGTHTQMQLIADKQKEMVEAYAQDKNLDIVHIGMVNTSTTAAPDDPYSIYQSDNFIIDMGEDSRMWLTDKNGNKQRYIMSAYTANKLLDEETSQVVSTKMHDAISAIKGVYDSYIINGKDAQSAETASSKMAKAMQSLSVEYYDNLRILSSGKNSIANTSTKIRLERSFNAKALVVDKLSTSDIVKAYGQEVADTSVYVGKDKAIELLGGEKYIKDFAEKYNFTYDDALGRMLDNMQNEGLFSIVKREPTNYAQSVSVTRVFYDANLAENQVGVGKVLAAFMKADSDGDLVSIAALTGKFTSTIKQTAEDKIEEHIETSSSHESFGTNIERNLLAGVQDIDLQVDETTKLLFNEAERNAETMAHSGTARMISAKINSGYTDDATINAGENIFKKWFGEITQDGKEKLGSLTKYAINGTIVNYDDVKTYIRLDDSARQSLDGVYQDYLNSDEYKKAAEAVFAVKKGQPQFDPNARLMAADQIAIANQYFKQVGSNNVSEDLMTAIRVNSARAVISDKALSDSMQGAAGINNTYTNRTRNLIDELTNKDIANLTPHQSNILMNVMAEIDENGQAPKNHQTIEPAEIKEAISDMWRMSRAYEGSWDWSTGKAQFVPAIGTDQAGSRFVDFMTSNFGNISEMKNMKQVVIPEGITDKETWMRQELASAVNNLLPDGQRLSGDYYYKTGSAYIQASADTPVVYDTTNTSDPLKRSTIIAQDMAEQAGDNEVYAEPFVMTEEIPIKQVRDFNSESSRKASHAEYTQEQYETNFVEPDYVNNVGTDTRSIIENFEEETGEDISTGAAIRRGASSIIHGISKSLTSSKGILALAGSIMAAGFIGGAPTAPSGSEAQQTVQDAPQYQIEGSLVGDISPQIYQRAPQGYVVNVNASSSRGQDYISGLMQQTMRSQFPNQNISMSMNINDSSSNISFRDIANYMQGMI